MTFFDRQIRVEFGRPGEFGLALTDVRISARIEKTASSESDTAVLQLYNLAESTRGRIEQDGAVVRVFAGYGASVGLVFSGDVDSLKVTYARPDIVTEVECSDGGRSVRFERVNETWSGPVSGLFLVSQLTSALGLPLSFVAPELADVVFERGYSASGPVRDALDEVLGTLGGAWTVQDGGVVVTTEDGAGQRVGPLLSPQSGLIGSPERTDEGVKVSALLQRSIQPRSVFRLESREFSGFYRAGDVQHTLDNGFDTPFYTETEATPYNA